MAKTASLIKLAENVLKAEDESESPDDDSMDYSDKEDKSVNESNDIETLKKNVSSLAKALKAIAKSQSTLIKHMEGGMGGQEEMPPMPPKDEGFPPNEHGDEGFGGDEFGGDEDDLDLDMYGEEFDPYGHEQQEPMRPADVTMNNVPMQMNNGKKVSGPRTKLTNSSSGARLAKDDSSSNYGEKDSDIPGNRVDLPDDKDKSAEMYLIQGGSGAGPGPVSKAISIDAIADAVVAKLSKARTVARSTTSPDVANSQLSKAETSMSQDALVKGAAEKLSFRDLNRMRVEAGLMSSGIL